MIGVHDRHIWTSDIPVLVLTDELIVALCFVPLNWLGRHCICPFLHTIPPIESVFLSFISITLPRDHILGVTQFTNLKRSHS